MVQGGKGLSVKPRGTEFQPQKRYREPDVSTLSSDLSARKKTQEDTCLLISQSSQMGKFQVQWDTLGPQ